MARESIRRRLLRRLIAPLLIIGVASGFATYWLAWVPARDAYDQSLANAAWELAGQLQGLPRGDALALAREIRRSLRGDRFDQMFFNVQDRNGILLAGDPGFPHRPIPYNLDRPVFYDGVYIGLPIRVVSVPTISGGELLLITIAETTIKRDAGRNKILATLLAWGLALSLTVTAIGWLSIGEGLSPLNRLRDDIARRSLHDLAPLDETRAPAEVAPLIAAINALMARIGEATRTQQSFLADVAHQLRTPLAGLVTQLAAARQHARSAELERSLHLMQGTADRTVRLANQLLALARAEFTGFHSERLLPLDLQALIQQNIDAWVWLCDAKRIEPHFELASAPVRGDEFLLRELLDNLVNNAVQYTPPGGRVTIGCRREAGTSIVYIEDSGTGIPAGERERVLEKFYRLPGTPGEGSGLGLAIVREIAKDHQADLVIGDGAGSGTRVELRFRGVR
ncbi:MAG: sensor histidine kinase [Solimonas sp.]